MRPAVVALALLVLGCLLSGCSVVSAGASVAGAAVDVAGTAVDVAGDAVGAVAGGSDDKKDR